MKIYILLGLCFITGCAVKMADSLIIPVSLISGIVELSSSFLNIINGLNERNDVYDSINKLSTKISSTNEMLYQKLVIHSQWNKIEETRLEIQSSLLDLKRCLTASTSERLKYRNLFIKRADKAISRVRFLASHLIDVVPGNSKSLLAMATEASRCNASGIDVMQAETMDLLSNGILVEMSLMRILDNFTLEQETLFWKHEINRVLSHFLSQHDACLLRQRSLVLEDLVSSVSASRLQNDNRKRYQWDWNDVFQIPKQIPKPFRHYIIDSDNVFITQGDATIKIITYGGSRKSHPYFAKSDLEKLVDSVIPGKDDAEDIATKVRTALMHTGVRFSAIIVFFNGQGIQPDIAIDTDTPALYVYTERSTYTYCMSTFCDINWDDWLGVNDRVSGYFTVYAVLDPTVYPVLDPILKGAPHPYNNENYHQGFVYDDAVACTYLLIVHLICILMVWCI